MQADDDPQPHTSAHESAGLAEQLGFASDDDLVDYLTERGYRATPAPGSRGVCAPDHDAR